MNRFVSGLLFGAGFGVALIAVFTAYSFYTVNKIEWVEESSDQTVVGGDRELVVPRSNLEAPAYKLREGIPHVMAIPKDGGILSVAVIVEATESTRPGTIQVWITESEAFEISTSGDEPMVKKLPYPDNKPEDFASDYVRERTPFNADNSTMPFDAVEVRALKMGGKSDKDSFFNGEFRITESGVVFFLPDEYET